MYKIIFGFILIVTSSFSKEELKFQIQKTVDNKKIEIILKKNTGNNEKKLQDYIIQPGDTLSEISINLNNSLDDLKNLNNIKNENLIRSYKILKYYVKEGEEDEV